MPRFYFDVVENGEVLHDETGLVLADLEAAKVEARKALGDMMREEIRDGATKRDPGEVAVLIRDHNLGPVVLTITYDVIDGSDDGGAS
jgi:hypothetical protein